jgi:hypothetical protein
MTLYEELRSRALRAGPFRPLNPDESDNAYLSRLTMAVSSITNEDFEAMSEAAKAWFDKACDVLNGAEPRIFAAPEGYTRDLASATLVTRPGGAIRRPRNAAPEEEQAPAPVQAAPEPAPVIAAPTEPETAPVVEAPEPVAPKARRRRQTKEQAKEALAQAAQPAQTGNGQDLGNGHDRAPAPVAEPPASAPEAAAPVNAEPVKPPRQPRRPPSAAHAGVSKRVRMMLIKNPDTSVNDLVTQLEAEGFDMEDRRATVSTLRYDTLATIAVAKEAGWAPPA